jgi:hypothetical protein
MGGLPGSAACGGRWNWEVCTPDVILESPSRRLKEDVKLWTGPSDWWSEMKIHVSVRSWHGLILCRGLAES